MNDFSYTQATSAKEAADLLKNKPATTYIAGGTTLLDMMKANLLTPSHLVDINLLPFKGIEKTANGLRIGAMERMSDVGEHPLVVQQYPAISKSLLLAASPSAPQHGQHRRQHPPAYTLRLLPRRGFSVQ